MCQNSISTVDCIVMNSNSNCNKDDLLNNTNTAQPGPSNNMDDDNRDNQSRCESSKRTRSASAGSRDNSPKKGTQTHVYDPEVADQLINAILQRVAELKEYGQEVQTQLPDEILSQEGVNEMSRTLDMLNEKVARCKEEGGWTRVCSTVPITTSIEGPVHACSTDRDNAIPTGRADGIEPAVEIDDMSSPLKKRAVSAPCLSPTGPPKKSPAKDSPISVTYRQNLQQMRHWVNFNTRIVGAAVINKTSRALKNKFKQVQKAIRGGEKVADGMGQEGDKPFPPPLDKKVVPHEESPVLQGAESISELRVVIATAESMVRSLIINRGGCNTRLVRLDAYRTLNVQVRQRSDADPVIDIQRKIRALCSHAVLYYEDADLNLTRVREWIARWGICWTSCSTPAPLLTKGIIEGDAGGGVMDMINSMRKTQGVESDDSMPIPQNDIASFCNRFWKNWMVANEKTALFTVTTEPVPQKEIAGMDKQAFPKALSFLASLEEEKTEKFIGETVNLRLRIAIFNIRGLKRKRILLSTMMALPLNNIDVLLLQETHALEGEKIDMVGYDAVSDPHPRSKSGGMAIYLSSNCDLTYGSELKAVKLYDESLTGTVQKAMVIIWRLKRVLLIINIHVTNKSPTDVWPRVEQEVLQSITSATHQGNQPFVIMGGDMNADLTNPDRASNPNERGLLMIIEQLKHLLTRVQNNATTRELLDRNSGEVVKRSCIDHLFIGNDLLKYMDGAAITEVARMRDVKAWEGNASDHLMVRSTIWVPVPKDPSVTEKLRPPNTYEASLSATNWLILPPAVVVAYTRDTLPSASIIRRIQSNDASKKMFIRLLNGAVEAMLNGESPPSLQNVIHILAECSNRAQDALPQTIKNGGVLRDKQNKEGTHLKKQKSPLLIRQIEDGPARLRRIQGKYEALKQVRAQLERNGVTDEVSIEKAVKLEAEIRSLHEKILYDLSSMREKEFRDQLLSFIRETGNGCASSPLSVGIWDMYKKMHDMNDPGNDPASHQKAVDTWGMFYKMKLSEGHEDAKIGGESEWKDEDESVVENMTPSELYDFVERAVHHWRMVDEGTVQQSIENDFGSSQPIHRRRKMVQSRRPPPEDAALAALQEMNNAITESEVWHAISRLKKKTAPGDDGVTSEVLRMDADASAKLLHPFFKKCWDEENAPSDLFKFLIRPLLKKGNPVVMTNYRPIALASVLGKVYEYIIEDRLRTAARTMGWINPGQAGFQPERNTVEQIFILHESAKARMRGKAATFAAFFDIKSAYDRVWRSGLWYKMWRMGIRGKIWRVLVQQYDNVEAQVTSADRTIRSELFKVPIGLRQGSALSPLLFLFFINDLLENIHREIAGIDISPLNRGLKEEDSAGLFARDRITCLAFADDVAGMTQNANQLQKLLNMAYDHSVRWRYTFAVGTEKTAVMMFNPTNNLMTNEYGEPLVFRMGKEEVPIVKRYRYLGAQITDDLSWKVDLDNTLKKVTTQFNMLRGYRIFPWGSYHFTPAVALRIYEATVMSRAVTHSEVVVAPMKFLHQIDSLQRQHLRTIMGLPKAYPAPLLMLQSGVTTVSEERRYRILLLYGRISLIYQHTENVKKLLEGMEIRHSIQDAQSGWLAAVDDAFSRLEKYGIQGREGEIGIAKRKPSDRTNDTVGGTTPYKKKKKKEEQACTVSDKGLQIGIFKSRIKRAILKRDWDLWVEKLIQKPSCFMIAAASGWLSLRRKAYLDPLLTLQIPTQKRKLMLLARANWLPAKSFLNGSANHGRIECPLCKEPEEGDNALHLIMNCPHHRIYESRCMMVTRCKQELEKLMETGGVHQYWVKRIRKLVQIVEGMCPSMPLTPQQKIRSRILQYEALGFLLFGCMTDRANWTELKKDRGKKTVSSITNAIWRYTIRETLGDMDDNKVRELIETNEMEKTDLIERAILLNQKKMKGKGDQPPIFSETIKVSLMNDTFTVKEVEDALLEEWRMNKEREKRNQILFWNNPALANKTLAFRTAVIAHATETLWAMWSEREKCIIKEKKRDEEKNGHTAEEETSGDNGEDSEEDMDAEISDEDEDEVGGK